MIRMQDLCLPLFLHANTMPNISIQLSLSWPIRYYILDFTSDRFSQSVDTLFKHTCASSFHYSFSINHSGVAERGREIRTMKDHKLLILNESIKPHLCICAPLMNMKCLTSYPYCRKFCRNTSSRLSGGVTKKHI